MRIRIFPAFKAALMNNFLIDPIISCDPVGAVTLPGLMAALARNDVRGFPRLRAHQRTAWHMFCTQLAALALREDSRAEAPKDESHWVDLLRALTLNYEDSPWCLVVEDSNLPAFLQPPDPGDLTWKHVPTPDALDLLITSRNHDLKTEIATDAEQEDWVYSLVSLQTSEGYGGQGNYGIARMNRGSSSRSFLGFAPSGGAAAPDVSEWWQRDLSVLLDNQNSKTKLTRGGISLLWCMPWEERTPIPAKKLDPWAIEICRRIRLIRDNNTIVAKQAPSKLARVDAKAYNGVLDDAWAPIDNENNKALTLGDKDFDYKLIRDLLLSGKWDVPKAARLRDDEKAGNMVLVAEALSRGNCKTYGFKSRTIPVPDYVHGFFRGDPERISSTANMQMREIENAEKALTEAVALYAAGGSDPVGKTHRQRAEELGKRLDATADKIFFPHLWKRVAAAKTGSKQAVTTADRDFPCASLRIYPCPTRQNPSLFPLATQATRERTD